MLKKMLIFYFFINYITSTFACERTLFDIPRNIWINHILSCLSDEECYFFHKVSKKALEVVFHQQNPKLWTEKIQSVRDNFFLEKIRNEAIVLGRMMKVIRTVQGTQQDSLEQFMDKLKYNVASDPYKSQQSKDFILKELKEIHEVSIMHANCFFFDSSFFIHNY